MVHVDELRSADITQIDGLTFLIRFNFELNFVWNNISNNVVIVFLFNPFVLVVKYVEFGLVDDHVFWIEHNFNGNGLIDD